MKQMIMLLLAVLLATLGLAGASSEDRQGLPGAGTENDPYLPRT